MIPVRYYGTLCCHQAYDAFPWFYMDISKLLGLVRVQSSHKHEFSRSCGSILTHHVFKVPVGSMSQLPHCQNMLEQCDILLHYLRAHVSFQGVRVFRMQRHAEFLQQMLHTISQMYTKYVKQNVQPPQNMFFEQPAYQQFLRTTQHVAASVEVVIDSEAQALPDVKDNRMFL